MADYSQQINAWFSNFERRFDSRVPTIVTETATEFYKERFRTQEWDKTPWKPLKPSYAAKKSRGAGRILTRTGQLSASIRHSVTTAARVVISAGSSSVPYARAHNEGMRIQGVAKVSGFTNRNFMGKGKPVQIKAHTRKINFQMPRRQFIGPSRYLNARLIERLTKGL